MEALFLILFFFYENNYILLIYLFLLSVLILKGTSILSSIVASPIYTPTNNTQSSLVYSSFPTDKSLIYLMNRQPKSYEVISHHGFDLHLPDDLYIECIFMYLLATSISSLEKCLFRSSAHFLYWIIWLFGYWVVKVLYNF